MAAQTVDKVLSTVCRYKSARASLQRFKHHFLVRFAHGQKMIKEAACSRSSRRACRRCGVHMKGLRPLHASPETTAYFVDDLRPPDAGRPALLCQRMILHRRAPEGCAVTGLDVGDVMRAADRYGGQWTRRGGLGGHVSLNGGGRRRLWTLLPALLGLAVQIIGGDDGGRRLWPAGAEQRVGRDAFKHADHSSFRFGGR